MTKTELAHTLSSQGNRTDGEQSLRLLAQAADELRDTLTVYDPKNGS